MHRRLVVSLRRLLHSFAYFLAGIVGLTIFVLTLMVAESIIYAIFRVSNSPWAIVLAAVVTAFYFSPIVRLLHHQIDHRLFPDKLDTANAIRQLGAGDLARLPLENIEQSLLKRISTICSRIPVALEEWDANGDRPLHYCYPRQAPPPASNGQRREPYTVALAIPLQQGKAWLHLGRRSDGWPLDDEERQGLEGLARFAATSLEHARLSHQQANEARLDSLSRVAAQLHSHDLKNRLHDLAFLAHNLDSGTLDQDEIRLLIKAVGKVTGRMQTLMQRLSDPRAPLDLKLAPCDLHQALQQEVSARLWPEGVTVCCNLTQVPLIHADHDLLFGVCENLFDNAVQAVNKQGTITISLDHHHDEIALRVQDNGIGMNKDFLHQRLFQLFTSSKEQGLGIGLYLSQRIIKLHHGTIQAQSDGQGCGSCFTIRLPVWCPKEGAHAP
ncbi:MAG: HAMP domain-containing sensor histidine kinase [Mariprofundales bacterium]|nr:HAMP domain-containing sensor histidine kinase [Mariprofundales bacterium]